jgi:hypothetical protein
MSEFVQDGPSRQRWSLAYGISLSAILAVAELLARRGYCGTPGAALICKVMRPSGS